MSTTTPTATRWARANSHARRAGSASRMEARAGAPASGTPPSAAGAEAASRSSAASNDVWSAGRPPGAPSATDSLAWVAPAPARDDAPGGLAAAGHARAWLSTDPGTRAERFYRRQGWVDTGRTAEGEIRFEKALV